MKNTSKIIETLKMNDNELDKKVRIQGTKYDRKVRYTDSDFKQARKLLREGKTWSEISSKVGIKTRDLRYHLEPEYRKSYLASLSGKHTGKDHITKQNRINYKRSLVAAGLVTA